MIKKLWRRFAPNPFDALLKRAAAQNKKRFLICWNRGLGDIPLGLYALVFRIKEFIPAAHVAVLTRKDLADGFALLDGVEVLVAPDWKRGMPITCAPELQSIFDVVLDNPDPTYWVKWQLGRLTPKLKWDSAWDELHKKFNLPDGCLGVHVQTETSYGYEKNWPRAHWEELFSQMQGRPILLFGSRAEPQFRFDNIVDLRGKTTLFELLSIIKNRCSTLVVPDSGVLSIAYFLDATFPLRLISLWADPRQGVLKQNVPSPNGALLHIPFIGERENVAEIKVEEVCAKIM